MKFNHQWYSYLLMGMLGIRVYFSFQSITQGLLSAVISGIFISQYVMALVLVYGHRKFGSLLAIFLGVLNSIIGTISFGFSLQPILQNVLLIAVSYIEYKRVKELENILPTLEEDKV